LKLAQAITLLHSIVFIERALDSQGFLQHVFLTSTYFTDIIFNLN